MINRLISLLFFVAATVFYGCTDNSARISGTLSGHAAGEYIILEELKSDNLSPVDSVKVSNDGTFSLKVDAKNPAFYLLKLDNANFLTMVVEPQQEINIKAHRDSLNYPLTVEGSEGTRLMADYNKKLRSTIDHLKVLNRVGNVIIKQERLLVHYEEQFLLRFTILEATETMKIQVRPFLAFRNIHQLTHANLFANTRVEPIENGIRSKMYDGFPYLNLQLSTKNEFVPVPDWYLGVEYIEEQKRGYDYQEDLFTPGFFEFKARKGDQIVFSASTKEEKTAGLKTKFTKSISVKIPRDSFINCLRNAAQQFVEKRAGRTLIIAGYPWFGAWGRDTFIALPGIALARHKLTLYRQVLDTQVASMRNGMFPNMGDPSNPAFNSIDAPLWFFWALQQYILQGGTDCWDRYSEAAKSVLNAYRQGTMFNIHMRENGLIFADAAGKSLTWMDAVVHGTPVTQRGGYAVEINALWYNAICFALEMATAAKDRKFVKEYDKLPLLIKKSFLELFWDEEKGYLADYVNDYEGKNFFVRPNMVIAVSMPHSMLERDQMKKILDIADKELVTSRGLRTLSPRNKLYKGICRGTQEERDHAYHQGTVWPWLYGPFCEGWLRVYGKQGVQRVKNLIYGMEEVMSEHGITTISEIYDGDPPHSPQGTISQAWSVGEVLRIIDILENQYSNQ